MITPSRSFPIRRASRIRSAALAFLGLAAVGQVAQASSGLTLDSTPELTFRSSNVFFYKAAQAPDGDVFVAGFFERVDGLSRGSLVRLNPDGSVDQAFTAMGPTAGIKAVHATPDGKVLVGGTFNELLGTARPRLARLLTDGTLDPSFNPDEPDMPQVDDIVPISDGGFYCVGLFLNSGSVIWRARRYGADGTFVPGAPLLEMTQFVRAYASGPAGELVALTADPGGGNKNIVHYFDSTGVHTTVNVPADFSPVGVAIDDSGALILAGQTFPEPGPGLIRILANGSLDSDFSGLPPIDHWSGIQVVRLSTGGFAVLSIYQGAYPVPEIVLFSAAGDYVTSLEIENGLNGYPINLKLDALADGDFVVHGWFRTVGGADAPGFARISSAGAVRSFPVSFQMNGSVEAIVALGGNRQLIGGTFSSVDGNLVESLTILGEDDAVLSTTPAVPFRVNRAFGTHDGGAVFFGSYPPLPGTGTTGLTRIRSTGQIDTAFLAGVPMHGFSAGAQLADDSFLLGGSIVSSSTPPGVGLIRVLPTGLLDPSFPTGAGPAGGGSTRISEIAADSAGRAVVVGNFTTYDGVSRPGIARIEVKGTLDTTFTPAIGLKPNPTPSNLMARADGHVFVIGTRSDAPAGIHQQWLHFFPDGSIDETFAPAVESVTSVSRYAVAADGSFYVAVRGTVTTPPRVLHLTSISTLDPTFVCQLDATGYVAEMTVDSSGRLWIGGRFATINGHAREGVARFALPPPVITSANQVNGQVGVEFSFEIVADNGSAYAASGLPPGLAVNGTTGIISGTPAVAGIFAVTLTASNAHHSTNGNLSLNFAKGVADITISGTAQPYDGTPQAVAVRTSPAGLATNITYDGSTTPPAAIGTYAVVATVTDTNYLGSAAATLQIAPGINLDQPSGTTTVSEGGATTLTVASAGTNSGTTFQWQIEVPTTGPAGAGPSATQWVNISGATAATYKMASTQHFHAGRYRVILNTNGVETISLPFTVAVTAPPPNNARLLNLSTRGLAQAGDNVLIPGFVISGSGTKKLLIRAVGPTLGKPPFSLAGVLPDPRMRLLRRNTTTQRFEEIAANDNWGTNSNAADITTTAASLFAFDFNDALESALLLDLAPGEYTVNAGGVGSTTGIAIVELYDSDPGTPGSKLINISNRGFAGVGDQVMIPGFVVSSEGPKTLLARVVGPTLGAAPFNVAGTMADPKLTIFSGQIPILANDNWSDNPDAAYTAQIASQVFAFPLTAGSKDAAFVVTLPPGSYTVVGSSAVPGGTGVVLVELYVVP